MINVIVDSCVFFGMIKYNNFLEQYGEEHLEELLIRQQEELSALRTEIGNHFDEEFIAKYKNLTFEQQIDKFKEYRNNKISNFEKDIKKCETLLKNNFIYDKDGQKKPLPEEIRKSLENRILQNQQKLTFYSEPIISFNDYKVLKNSIANGTLYKMALDKEVKLNLFFVSYDEIINHTKEKENYKKWKSFTPEEVNSLTQKLFSLITTNSKEVITDLQNLARQYREPVTIDGRSEMANDINSNGVYGDSLIMAGANMSGMILLTQNVKDFIWAKKISKNNDFIRQNVFNVSQNNDYSTDALAYSVDEFLSENYNVPSKQNEKYTLRLSKSNNTNFINTVEFV